MLSFQSLILLRKHLLCAQFSKYFGEPKYRWRQDTIPRSIKDTTRVSQKKNHLFWKAESHKLLCHSPTPSFVWKYIYNIYNKLEVLEKGWRRPRGVAPDRGKRTTSRENYWISTLPGRAGKDFLCLQGRKKKKKKASCPPAPHLLSFGKENICQDNKLQHCYHSNTK